LHTDACAIQPSLVEESKTSYYETLEMASQGWHESEHDVMPWVEYFWGVMTRAYKDFEERVASLPEGRGSKTQMIRDAVRRRLRPFAISDVERDCPGVSRPMVRKVLEDLRTEDVIELRGKGRAARYHKTDL
jgi:Fic family protein